MSIEREGKILEVDKDLVIKRILELWGLKLSSGEIVWEYYQHWETKLRVRQEDRGIVLCLKRDTKEQSNMKIKDEIEVIVDSKENLLEILFELGVKETRKVKKIRTSFSLDNTRVEIDEYEVSLWIPTLLEIEGDTDQEIISVAEKLGFTVDQITSYSFSDLEKIYWKK